MVFGFGKSVKHREIDAAAPLAASSRLRVRRTDLDMNQHVNNVRCACPRTPVSRARRQRRWRLTWSRRRRRSYLEWMSDDVPAALHGTHALTGADIEYRAEGHYGDEVLSRSVEVEVAAGAAGAGARAFDHSLSAARGGADVGGVELLRARTLWSPVAAAS